MARSVAIPARQLAVRIIIICFATMLESSKPISAREIRLVKTSTIIRVLAFLIEGKSSAKFKKSNGSYPTDDRQRIRGLNSCVRRHLSRQFHIFRAERKWPLHE